MAAPFQPDLSLAELSARVRSLMEEDLAPELAIRSFLGNLEKLYAGETGYIPVSTLTETGTIPVYEETCAFAEAGRRELPRTLLIKLNGGLGASMGLDGPKSLIEVRDGLTFLDVLIRQVESLRETSGTAIPLLLMNSSATDVETIEALAQKHPTFANPHGLPICFRQHRVPKLDAQTGRPAQQTANPDDAWCPPGHADIYCALQTTGILTTLLAAGFRYAFISNADNLGALLDCGILGFIADKRIPFLMEVTARTESDRKGGHLARNAHTGRLLLREGAQCPPEEIADFQNIHRHRFFNTNNLWVDLEALAAMLAAHDGLPGLPLIENRKPVVPSDPSSPLIIQLESAMGAAISSFEDAMALHVSRHRFAPVKTTNDLLSVRSDAYHFADDASLSLHPSRQGIPPDIRLDPRFYARYADFATRFPQGAPSLLHCRLLTVEGDYSFGRNITAQGDVTLRAPDAAAIHLPDNTHLP